MSACVGPADWNLKTLRTAGARVSAMACTLRPVARNSPPRHMFFHLCALRIGDGATETLAGGTTGESGQIG